MRAVAFGTPHPAVARAQHLIAAPVLGTAAGLGWLRLLGPDGMPDTATANDAAVFAPMWLAMIAAMMLPTIEPMVATHLSLTTGGVARRALTSATFIAPYVAAWSVAGLVAYALRTVAMDRPPVIAALVGLAGVYQLAGVKDACLRACRTPFAFLLQHGSGNSLRAALVLGGRHAAVCVGCCAGLMAALVAAGAVDPLWMAAVGLLMLVEKALPSGVLVARVAGVGLIAVAVALAVSGT